MGGHLPPRGTVGLAPAQVAAGLTIAAVAGMALAAPMGYIADRRGARGVQVMARAAGGRVRRNDAHSHRVGVRLRDATAVIRRGALVVGASCVLFGLSAGGRRGSPAYSCALRAGLLLPHLIRWGLRQRITRSALAQAA